MSTYTKYLTESNVIYRNAIEPSSGDTGNDYMRVGNNSSGSAYFILLQLPSDLPGSAVVNAASLRLTEYDSSYRGAASLEVNIARITGAWTASTNYNALPAYDTGTIDTITLDSTNNPASDNYDGRQQYWRYGKYVWNGSSWDDTGTNVSLTYYNGANYTSGGYLYLYETTFYADYWVWQDIDVSAVIQDCINDGCTGLILYFTTPGTNDTRKYFRSPYNTTTDKQPLLTIDYVADPSPTAPTIPAVGTVTTGPKAFDWADATDTSGNFTSSELYYEMQFSDDDGATWSATNTSAEGASTCTLNLKTLLSLEALEYYYNAICKIQVRTKTPLYGGSNYYSAWTISSAFAVDYRLGLSVPASLAVDNDSPYEGETVEFTVGRPATYNSHADGGAVMDITYYVKIKDGIALEDATEAATSATKVISYVVGNLTSGDDLVTNVVAYAIDAESQQSVETANLAFTINRYRAPVINISEIVRAATTAAVSVDIIDTGYGGVQASSQIEKIQYRLNAGSWVDATLSAWSGLSNTFTIGSLTESLSYALEVRAINNEPAATGLAHKTGDADAETILSYMPIGFTYHNKNNGKMGFGARALLIHSTDIGETHQPANGSGYIEDDLDVGGALEVTGIATVGDGSLLASDAAPTTDAMIANKKYVDDEVAGITVTLPNLRKVYETTVAGSATTTISTGAITKTGSGIFKVLLLLKEGASGNTDVSVRVNGHANNTGYISRMVRDGAVSVYTDSGFVCFSASAGTGHAEFMVGVVDADLQCSGIGGRSLHSATADESIQYTVLFPNGCSTAISQINLVASNANGFGVGTYVIVYEYDNN